MPKALSFTPDQPQPAGAQQGPRVLGFTPDQPHNQGVEQPASTNRTVTGFTPDHPPTGVLGFVPDSPAYFQPPAGGGLIQPPSLGQEQFPIATPTPQPAAQGGWGGAEAWTAQARAQPAPTQAAQPNPVVHGEFGPAQQLPVGGVQALMQQQHGQRIAAAEEPYVAYRNSLAMREHVRQAIESGDKELANRLVDSALDNLRLATGTLTPEMLQARTAADIQRKSVSPAVSVVSDVARGAGDVLFAKPASAVDYGAHLAGYDTEFGPTFSRGIHRLNPTNPDTAESFAGGALPRALGSAGAYVPIAAASMPLAIAHGATAGAGEGYDVARQSDATELQTIGSVAGHAALGATEGLPFMNFVNRMDKGTGGLFSRVTNESIQKAIGTGVKRDVSRRVIAGAIEQGVEEALQEMGSEAARNALVDALDIEDRHLLDNVSDGGLAGFVVGSVLGGASGGVGGVDAVAQQPAQGQQPRVDAVQAAQGAQAASDDPLTANLKARGYTEQQIADFTPEQVESIQSTPQPAVGVTDEWASQQIEQDNRLAAEGLDLPEGAEVQGVADTAENRRRAVESVVRAAPALGSAKVTRSQEGGYDLQLPGGGRAAFRVATEEELAQLESESPKAVAESIVAAIRDEMPQEHQRAAESQSPVHTDIDGRSVRVPTTADEFMALEDSDRVAWLNAFPAQGAFDRNAVTVDSDGTLIIPQNPELTGISHEAVHWFKTAGLIQPKEYDALVDVSGGAAESDAATEERVANYVQSRVTESMQTAREFDAASAWRKIPMAVRDALGRIRDFIMAAVGSKQAMGRRAVRAFESGRMAARPVSTEAMERRARAGQRQEQATQQTTRPTVAEQTTAGEQAGAQMTTTEEVVDTPQRTARPDEAQGQKTKTPDGASMERPVSAPAPVASGRVTAESIESSMSIKQMVAVAKRLNSRFKADIKLGKNKKDMAKRLAEAHGRGFHVEPVANPLTMDKAWHGQTVYAHETMGSWKLAKGSALPGDRGRKVRTLPSSWHNQMEVAPADAKKLVGVIEQMTDQVLLVKGKATNSYGPRGAVAAPKGVVELAKARVPDWDAEVKAAEGVRAEKRQKRQREAKKAETIRWQDLSFVDKRRVAAEAKRAGMKPGEYLKTVESKRLEESVVDLEAPITKGESMATPRAEGDLPFARRKLRGTGNADIEAVLRKTFKTIIDESTNVAKLSTGGDAGKLKQQLKFESKAARRGYYAGKRDTIEVFKAKLSVVKEKAKLQKDELRKRIIEARREGKSAEAARRQAIDDRVKALRDSLAAEVNDRLPKEVRGAFVNTVKNVRTFTSFLNGIQKIEDAMEKHEHRQALGALRKTLKKLDLSKMRPEFRKPVESLVGDIDLANISSKKRMAFRRVAEYLAQSPDNALPEEVMRSLDRLRKRQPVDLSADELRDIDTAVRHFVHLNVFKNKLLKKNWAKGIDETSNSVSEETGDQKLPQSLSIRKAVKRLLNMKPTAKDIEDSRASMVRQYFNEASTRLEQLLLERSPTLHSIVYEAIGGDGRNKQLRFEQEAYDFMAAEMAKVGLEIGTNKFENWRHELVAIKTEAGDLHLSNDEAAELVARTMDPYLRANIEGWGYTVGRTEVESTHPITAADIESLADQLDAKVWQAAAAAHELYNSKYKDEINREWVNVHNFEKAVRDNYYPGGRDMLRQPTGGNVKEILDRFGNRTIESQSIWKERTGGTSPIRGGGLFDTFADHTSAVSRTVAYLSPLRDMQAVLGQPNVKLALARAYGKQFIEHINSIVNDQVMGPQGFDVTDSVFRRYMGNAAVGILGLKASTMMIQPAGLFISAAYTDPSFLLRSLSAPMRWGEINALARKHSPQWRERYENFFHHVTSGVFGEGHRSFGATPWRERFLKHIEKMDKLGGMIRWSMAEMEVQRDRPELEHGTDAYYDQVARAWERLINRGENTSAPIEHSGLLASGKRHAAIGLFVMFGSAPSKIYAAIRSAAMDIRNGNTRSASRKLTMVAASSILVALVRDLWDEARDRDDDDRPSMVARVASELSGTLLVFGDIPSAVITYLDTGRSFGANDNVVTQLFDTAISATVNVAAAAEAYDEDLRDAEGGKIGHQKMLKAADATARAASLAFGLPYLAIRDYYRVGKAIAGDQPPMSELKRELNKDGEKVSFTNDRRKVLAALESADSSAFRSAIEQWVSKAEKNDQPYEIDLFDIIDLRYGWLEDLDTDRDTRDLTDDQRAAIEYYMLERDRLKETASKFAAENRTAFIPKPGAVSTKR